MSYTRRMGTTARPPVPQSLCGECRREYVHDVHDKIKEHNILFVLNANQTPSFVYLMGSQKLLQGEESQSPLRA